MIRLDSQIGTTEIIPIELLETITEADPSLSQIETNSVSPLSEPAIVSEVTGHTQNGAETTALSSAEPTAGSTSNLGETAGSTSNLGETVGSTSNLGETVGSTSNLGETAGSTSNLGETVGLTSNLGETAGSTSNPDQTPPTQPNIGSTSDRIGVSLKIENGGRDIPPVSAQPNSQSTFFALDQITVLICFEEQLNRLLT